MKNLEYTWNKDYIALNLLDEDIIKKSNIELLPNEIFVEHPRYKDYYVSQKGRIISLKRHKVELLSHFRGGQPDRQYYYYTLQYNGKQKTIGEHRAVADVYCPNFWSDNTKLEAHHCNDNKLDNNYTNIVLLSTKLHYAIHKIKRVRVYVDGAMIDYSNPLDIVSQTDLTLDDIILARDKYKPLKKLRGKDIVFEIKGNILGFQYKK